MNHNNHWLPTVSCLLISLLGFTTAAAGEPIEPSEPGQSGEPNQLGEPTEAQPTRSAVTNTGTLQMLFSHAQTYDAGFRAAAARSAANSEAYTLERAFLLPRVDLSAELGYSRDRIISNPFGGSGTDSYSTTSYALQVVQPVFHWEILSHLRRGEAQTQAAQIQLAQAEQALLQRLINAYLDTQLTQVSVELAQTNVRAIQEQLDDNKTRFEVGTIAITGLKEAQSRFDLARADLIDSEQAQRTSQLLLNQITGLPTPKQPLITPRFGATMPKPAELDAWTQQAVQNNLNVGLAALQASVADENIIFAEQDHYPEINLIGTYTQRDSRSSFGSETENQQLRLQFSLPLFRGGATMANVRAARQNYLAASADLEHAQRQAKLQAQTAYYAVQSAISRIRALTQAVDSANASFKAVQDGFELGSRTSAEVLDTQTAALSTQQRLIAARYDYLRAVTDLAASTGQLNLEHLAWLDRMLGQQYAADQ